MGGTDDPSNLVKVTIEEHAALHKQLWEDLGHWQDYVAWKVLSGQMTNAEANVEKIRQMNLEAVENKTHHFCNSEWQKKYSRQKVQNGTHHFLGGKIQKRMIENGTHHFCNRDNLKKYARKRIENGTHNMHNKITCPKCKKSMIGPLYVRWGHGDNCTKYIED
jgi:hypothetical protein